MNEDKLEKLARIASQMNPEKVAEATKKMEEELAEKMKNMTEEERLKLLAFQKVLTHQTVEALTNAKNNPASSEYVNSLLENKLSPPIKQELRPDDILLNALRYENLDNFISLMKSQNRRAEAQVQFVTDSEPHPLLHWASLDNRLEVVRYLMQELKSNNKGKLVDQRNVRGETALHWACIKGHTQVIHELINKNDADFHLADTKGYSAMHIAAQNDQVFTMAQLARKGLQVNVRDNNGRTPLHWAAYKGFEKSTRWLLSHGADPFVEDWEKCLPIHWASIRGHVTIIQILVELGGSGPAFKLKDSTGGTPQSLAELKIEKIKLQKAQNDQPSSTPDFALINYERVVHYCKERSKTEEAIEKNGGKPTLLMRISGKLPHWSYFLWPVLAPIGWYQYYTVVLPVTSEHLLLHFAFVVCFWLKWFFWIRLQVVDPGEYVVPHGPPGTTLGVGSLSPTWGWRRNGWPDFTLHNKKSSDNNNIVDVRATKVNPNPAMNYYAAKHRALYDRALDEGLLIPVCLTCEIAKPVRAKHDKITDICVAKFDHFCPWMNSCIGEMNYRDFFFTAVCATISMWSWLILVVLYTSQLNEHKGWFENFASIWKWELFAWSYLAMAVYGIGMTGQHIWLAAKNLSTNEMISGARYRYLVEDGTRGNPFNKGVLINFAELIGLVGPSRLSPEQYYADEIAGGEVRPIPEPVVGSPWHVSRNTHHGHSHDDDDEHHHGHSHA